MQSQINHTRLVCIDGFPRSGTTWLATILDSHAHVMYRHEPLARLASHIEPNLFRLLLKNHGLSAEERVQCVEALLAPHHETDRPPFFGKSHLPIPAILKFFLWGCARTVPMLRPLYKKLAAPRLQDDAIFVMKETGWTFQLESILAGLQPELTLFILRSPYGVVASHLQGLQKRFVALPDESMRQKWFRHHAREPFLRKMAWQEHDILRMSLVRFYALAWRIKLERCVDLFDHYDKMQFIVYEDLVQHTESIIQPILEALQLSYTQQTRDFIRRSTGQEKARIFPFEVKRSYYSVYQKNRSGLERWKQTLSADDIRDIQGMLAGVEYLSKDQNINDMIRKVVHPQDITRLTQVS